MDKKITIVLADDHKLLTSGMKMLIDTWDEFELAGIAVDGKSTVELCDLTEPDIVLMDMKMPVLDGAEAARIIKERHENTKVIAMTAFDDSETVRDAMKKGCDGFLMKVIEPEQLRAAIHSILNGVSVVDEQALEHMKNQIQKQEECAFTEREIKILSYISRGMTNREIAEKLSLQPGTIKNIVSILLSKTFCVSRSDLARYAVENALVRAEE